MKKYSMALLSLLITFILVACKDEATSNAGSSITDNSHGESQTIATQDIPTVALNIYILSDEYNYL